MIAIYFKVKIMPLLDLIKAGLKKVGINEKYADKVVSVFKVEKEEDVEGAIERFKTEIHPLIATELEVEKQKAIADYEAKHKIKDGKPIEVEEKKNEENDETPAWFKVWSKAQEERTTKLEREQSLSAKQAIVKEKFTTSKLPEKWLGRINPESETSIDDQIKELQDEYAEIKQSSVTEQLGGVNYTPASNVDKMSEADLIKVMNGESTQEDSGAVKLDV
ncbi:MAG: hypothetical protein ACRDDZ_01305 [Marinifilaceae bacterium]